MHKNDSFKTREKAQISEKEERRKIIEMGCLLCAG
jgi:hypothetical protein